MALTKCKDCNAQISDKATACPQCGAKPSKQTSRFTIFFGGLFTIAIAMLVFKDDTKTEALVNAPSTKQAEAQKQEKIKADARFDLAFETAKTIKKSMRDPDSFKVEYIGVNDQATVACAKYRSRNGFGGMNKEFAVVANNKVTQSAADWNKLCTQLLYDETTAGG